MLNTQNVYIPYKLCDHVHLQIIKDIVFYVDLRFDRFVQIHKCIHDQIFEDAREHHYSDNISATISKLLKMGIIEPDLSKIQVGQASIYVNKNKKNLKENVCIREIFVDDLSILACLKQKEYITDETMVNYLDPLSTKKTFENIDINGYIFSDSYYNLDRYEKASCRGIVLEISSVPNDEELKSIVSLLKWHSIRLVVNYNTPKEIVERLKELVSLFRSEGLSISYDYCVMLNSNTQPDQMEFLVVPNIQNPRLKKVKLSCGAGITKFYINKNGDIYSCYRLRDAKPLGNVYLEHSTHFINKRKLNHLISFAQPCKSCEVSFFCGGGCKAEMYDNKYAFCEKMKKAIIDELTGKNRKFNLALIKQYDNLNDYTYMCERNALRMLLLGYQTPDPLLFMCCGLYIKDIDFLRSGTFSSTFSRPIFDPVLIPVLGDKANGLDWAIIDYHLESGQPVLIHVDVFYLPYKKDTHYNQTHGSHAVILLDKTKDGYMVLDWYHPDYFYGEVSLNALNDARTSKNQKNQISAFSGIPINAEYRLLHINMLPDNIDIKKSVYSTLFCSLKSMSDENGAISFFKKYSTEVPSWLISSNKIAYENAIESFFFAELELRFLELYFLRMSTEEQFNYIDFNIIIDTVVKMKVLIQRIKNSLIIAFRKEKRMDKNNWCSFMVEMHNELCLYYKSVVDVLKRIKNTQRV